MKNKNSQSIRNIIRKNRWVLIALLLAGIFLISVFLLYHFEKEGASQITIFDAFRMVLIFFFGEYGDTPRTQAGKIISIVLFILGIIVVASLIGKMASIFLKMNMEVQVPNKIDDHIVMCNWNDSGDRIIKEIHSPLASPETEIIVITELEINEIELRLSAEYEKVFFIRSDPTMHSVLKRARAHLAKSIIILADMDCTDPDAKTALTALAITNLEKDSPHKPHIIAETINHRKINHLIDAGVDEWVCAVDYGLGIIAQSALYGKLSEVYQQLLTYSNETNEIYLVDRKKYPAGFQGKSFHEVANILNKNKNPKNPCIIIGVKRAGQVILNPKKGDFDFFKPDDCLIVMSFDPPDLRYLEGK